MSILRSSSRSRSLDNSRKQKHICGLVSNPCSSVDVHLDAKNTRHWTVLLYYQANENMSLIPKLSERRLTNFEAKKLELVEDCSKYERELEETPLHSLDLYEF